MKKLGVLALIPVIMLAGFLLFNSSNVSSALQPFKYKGEVCSYVQRGGEWQLVGCNHNLITNAGKDWIKTVLAKGGTFPNVTVIALANNTVAQSASDTALQGEWTTCGLARTLANSYVDNGYGNWSISYTWTATCDEVIVNATGLYTNEATPKLFAETTLPKVILYNGDNYMVTWTITVS